MQSILQADDIPLGNSTDTTRLPAQKVHNYRSDRSSSLKYFSGDSRGCFTWSSMELVLHSDDVRSGYSNDTTRVPAQKVHNCRSDRWIALKFFSGVSRGCFTWSSVELVLHSDDVRSGYSSDTTRVPAQKVHNYRSDRWIALKRFLGVSGGCFTWSSVQLILHADDIRSGHCNDTMGVPDPKVHNYRSDRWNALIFFLEFPEAVLNGVAWNWYSTPTLCGRAIPPTRPQYRLERFITIDQNFGSL